MLVSTQGSRKIRVGLMLCSCRGQRDGPHGTHSPYRVTTVFGGVKLKEERELVEGACRISIHIGCSWRDFFCLFCLGARPRDTQRLFLAVYSGIIPTGFRGLYGMLRMEPGFTTSELYPQCYSWCLRESVLQMPNLCPLYAFVESLTGWGALMVYCS